VSFEQFWKRNERDLASRHYQEGKWNVHALAEEIYERSQHVHADDDAERVE
jgi:hypothetical protein